MTWWQAIILGLVEGITEYLPISSTGHLIITTALLGLDDAAVKQAVDTFSIIIQGGAIIAVLGLYRRRVAQMIRGLLGRDPVGRRLFVNLVIAFLPAAILGVLLDDLIGRHLFRLTPVLVALALGGIWMIWLDRRSKRRGETGQWLAIEELSGWQALMIGLFQVVAMWPGTSRSMMTIAGGTMCGLRPAQAAEFSFLLGLPTLGGACVYKLAKDLTGDGPTMFETLSWTPVLLGIVVATLTAALAIKWLVAYLTRHGLAVFGWYRLALTAVLLVLALSGVVTVTA